MAGIGYQLLHSDAFSAELEALGLGSSLFGAAGIPAPIFQSLVPRRAGVFDANANTFGTVDEPATFTRASDGIYRDSSGLYQIASPNAIRAEYSSAGAFLGYLFEPEATNKVICYNANPDAGLTGVTKAGDAAAVVSRVLDVELLEQAKLNGICTNGYVLELDNSAGSGYAFMRLSETFGNLNVHTRSAWARKISGAGICRLQDSNGANQAQITSQESYEWVSATGAPTSSGATLVMYVENGVVCRIILPQLEESPVATSPIVTTGASATRAVDALSWGVLLSGFSHSAGVVMVQLSHPHDYASLAAAQPVLTLRGSIVGHISLIAGATEVVRMSDGVSSIQKAMSGGDLSANERAICATRWGSGTMDIGTYTASSSWSWVGSSAYAGSFPHTNSLDVLPNVAVPYHVSAVCVSNRDLSTANIERLFTP